MNLGLAAGVAGVILTAVAYIMAATAFPAASVVSLGFILLAAFAWWSGAWRTAVTTIYFAVVAAIASPALFRIDIPLKWIGLLGGAGILLGAVLLVQYFTSARNA